MGDSAPFLSLPEETAVREEPQGEEEDHVEEPASGVSNRRAALTVAVLCYINLLNYMDRFTVAGVLPEIENFFDIGDSKSGLLQTVTLCSSFIPKEHFWLLLLTRGLVGVGEASYSTIAPTIIADLYIADRRSRMLSVFYFAIPVGRHSSETPPPHCQHSSETSPLHCKHSSETSPPHCRHSSETPPPHCRHSSETPPPHCQHSSETPPPHCKHSSETPHPHCKHSSETPPPHCRHSSETPPPHCKHSSETPPPLCSGLGYIMGSNMEHITGDWHWALRVTPALGLLAVVALLLVVKEPLRGAVESRPEQTLVHTSWLSDIRELSKNRSFLLSSFGFTAVAFVTGSLALWAPAFLYRARVVQGELPPCLPEQSCGSQESRSFLLSSFGFTAVAFVTGSLALWAPAFLYRARVVQGELPPCLPEQSCGSQESLIFGIITCVTGLLGVGSGVEISRRLRPSNPRSDPLVCAAGLLVSSPFLYLAIVTAQASTPATYVFIFLGETFLSLNWAIVADMLLYVVVPTRRSTAEAFQIVLSHLLGDAGSPYLIGVD
ncbi:UNVERIFIED_CONTAM: hypothetical protein FKN15_058258 [Acipenser sinensis]